MSCLRTSGKNSPGKRICIHCCSDRRAGRETDADSNRLEIREEERTSSDERRETDVVGRLVLRELCSEMETKGECEENN